MARQNEQGNYVIVTNVLSGLASPVISLASRFGFMASKQASGLYLLPFDPSKFKYHADFLTFTIHFSPLT
jgi:hypothetical protein